LDLLAAVRFLTIVPIPWRRAESAEALGRSQACFPLVGLGLGLALSRQTVLDHGGDMWAESEPGDACFRLRLPVSPAVAPAARVQYG